MPEQAVEAVKSAIDAACGRAGFKLRPHALSDFATAALTAALPLIRAQVLEEAVAVCEWPPEAMINNEFARGMATACALDRQAIRELKENQP